jgi:hypothetical protein
MVMAIRLGPCHAFTFDLAKSFESINRRRSEVNTNCLVWQRYGFVIYFYSFVFLFGESATPRIAHDYFELLSREITYRLRHHFSFPIYCTRNCDDFAGLVPIKHARHCSAAFDIATGVIADAGIPIQVTKSFPNSAAIDWHGFEMDFVAQTIGYGATKCARLLISIVTSLVTPPRFTKGRSLLGSLEHLCCADVYLAPHVPAIRACVFAAEHLSQPITWSSEAISDLHRFRDRLAGTDYLPRARFQDHFVDPTVDFTTCYSDASGRADRGVGGYTDNLYSCVPWSELPSWLLSDEHSSTGLIELVGLLLLVLLCDCRSICWITDSTAADGAWTNHRSPSAPCNALIKLIHFHLARTHSLVHSRHVNRDLNTLADILSHCDHRAYWEQRPPSDLQRFSPTGVMLNAALSTLTPHFG